MLGATASQLLDIARERTGLSDLGEGDFLPALEQLVASIDREATLTEDGRRAAQERFIRLLVNRLRFQADLDRHPGILDERVVPPVVICGLPRVGSTKLHRLLAEGQDFQTLLFWQGFNPAPMPAPPDGGEDPRIAEAVRFLEWRARLNPATNAAHYMAALDPEEDTYLLEYTLRTYWPISYFEVPGFLAWLRTQDRDDAFRYVSRLLKYLQWQFHHDAPRPWVLKSPPNLGYENHLARHLPGARFVVLHRDPVDVIPSAAAIVREVRRLYGGAPAACSKVAAWGLEEFASAMDRHVAWRDTKPANAVLDIAYRDVRDHDIDVVRRVYEFCGMELTRDAEARMADWSRVNSQHKHGVHQYSLEESGLTSAQIERRFSTYIGRFGPLLAG
jgi:Sulfotransferase family